MIYEFRTYTLKPRSLGEVEKRYAEAYEYRKKYSPLAAFWHTEVGPLNEIIHVWGYKDLAERARIRAEAAKDANWPPKIREFVVDQDVEVVNPFLYIMSRVDDIINVAGHRLSTGAMEEVLSAHPDVAECAVMGVADEIKGEVPVGLVVTKAGVARADADLCRELVELVREKIGPVAAFKTVAVVKRLPKTRSGKILRGTMKKIADGVEHGVPATIDDPAVLGEIGDSLKALGYPR